MAIEGLNNLIIILSLISSSNEGSFHYGFMNKKRKVHLHSYKTRERKKCVILPSKYDILWQITHLLCDK